MCRLCIGSWDTQDNKIGLCWCSHSSSWSFTTLGEQVVKYRPLWDSGLLLGLRIFIFSNYCLVKIIWISRAVKTSCVFCTLQRCLVPSKSPYQQHLPRVSKRIILPLPALFFFPFQEDHKGKSGRECKQHHRESDGHQQDDVPAGAAEWGDRADLRYSWNLGMDGGEGAPLGSSVCRVGECAAGMVSRTPLTAGHKQEISVCFVWGLCLLEFLFSDHEREEGSGWGWVSCKSNVSSQCPECLVLLCATVLAWAGGWQRGHKHGYKSLHRGRSVCRAASSQAPAGMAETLRSSALNLRSLALSAVHQGLWNQDFTQFLGFDS